MILKKYPEDFVVEEVIEIKHEKNDCLIFTLEKKNWDTLVVLKYLARNLGISKKRIGYAGLKDKRALTRQKISLKGGTPEILENLILRDVRVYDFEYGDRINVGDHLGNRFEITVRDCKVSRDELIKREERLKEVGGFSNFFGEQRFGGSEIVGKFLVKGDLEEALMQYLCKPYIHFPPGKELLESRNFKKALKEFPKHLRFERAILQRLSEGRSFEDAFKVLPLHLATFFVHAYQAKIFNEILRERMRHVPLNVAEVGDVVYSDEFGRRAYMFVTEQNIEKINEKKFGVVLPIVGYKTKVRGRVREILDKILEREGISLENFKLKMKKLSSRGTYREILGKCSDLEWRIEDSKVILKFFLPKGSYATVFVDEFLSGK